jgi:hypothetical protein
MKRLLFILFFFIAVSSIAQDALDSAWIRENFDKVERMIPMRDGIKLFSAIYIPWNTYGTIEWLSKNIDRNNDKLFQPSTLNPQILWI